MSAPFNSLARLLKGYHAPERQPSLPAPAATPRPERSKVAGNPVRVPVNRQTALLLRPNREWLSQPLPPAKLPTREDAEIARLKAELKTERNEHALTRDALGEARAQLRHAKRATEALQAEVERLRQDCQQKDRTIAQLEDLKL